MTNPTTQSGFTLLEVMIALVIFSIGLLGLSGLQAISLQNNQVAYSRTVATMLTYDMADRIRNNPTATSVTIPGSATTCVGATPCDSAAMRARDLWEWDQSVKDAQNTNLTNAVGFISLTGNTYTISIAWDEERKGNPPPTACPPAANSGFACVSIMVTP